MPDHELWTGFLTDPDGNLVGLMKDKRNRQSVLVQENARHSEVVGLRCGLRNAYQNKGWSPVNIQSHVSEAISYWERKRIVYNIVLACLVLTCWGEDMLLGGPAQSLGNGIVLLTLAGIANVLYCFAYPVDFAFQITPLKAVWQRHRLMLFTSGLLLASALALWVMLHTAMA
ncbi:MAG: hypothetical protein P8J37_18290 [Fuerstiella sp.]|nr:hypothetical protein [Fuerstiella sp.]